MGTTWSQVFPPAPTLTEANLPSQKGKVFLVTGGYSGVGFELCTILYQAGGKVYLAGRSEQKAADAIAKIKASIPSSDGEIAFLLLHLDDLTTIKPAVDTFTAVESRLDVLFNNAGVYNPPRGSVSKQSHDLQMATNCLGPHLLTQLLLPTLRRTAESQPAASVRVVWTASLLVDVTAPKGAVDLEEVLRRDTPPSRGYDNSKVGNWFLADALATQVGSSGILSVVVNPGLLKTEIARHFHPFVQALLAPLLRPPRMGAYSELWAGLSTELSISDGGRFIMPWGRFHPSPRQDFVQAMKSTQEGGSGAAALFLQYCDDQILEFK